MTKPSDTVSSTQGAPKLPSAAELCAIMERKKQERAAQELKQHTAAEEERKHQEEMFLERKLTPDFIELVATRIRNAAESGAVEIMIGQFPSAWCTDGGRKISELEDDWPDTLQGFAREFYAFWKRELKSRGFRLRVEIINFPDGKPGDVGAFLSWEA